MMGVETFVARSGEMDTMLRPSVDLSFCDMSTQRIETLVGSNIGNFSFFWIAGE
jgi:hypothetical protein